MMRRLSREERELWRQLRRSVRPLRTTPQEMLDEASLPPVEQPPPPAAAPSIAATLARAAPPGARPLTQLEDKARRRLLRGIIGIDARIDLHGMRQERAFAALIAFLRQAQAQGAGLVLVITGKGRQGEEGRGILRQMAPAWLARPDFRDLVLGFEEAGLRHGGNGALYVRLRRRRIEGTS